MIDKVSDFMKTIAVVRETHTCDCKCHAPEIIETGLHTEGTHATILGWRCEPCLQGC